LGGLTPLLKISDFIKNKESKSIDMDKGIKQIQQNKMAPETTTKSIKTKSIKTNNLQNYGENTE
jgi:hypothetical protein